MNPAKRENQVENVLWFGRSFRASPRFALHDVNVPEMKALAEMATGIM
jgi:hypothetical protein